MDSLDKFSAHEVLHMSNFFCGAIEKELLEHPYVKANQELSERVHDIVMMLAFLYQRVGELQE